MDNGLPVKPFLILKEPVHKLIDPLLCSSVSWASNYLAIAVYKNNAALLGIGVKDQWIYRQIPVLQLHYRQSPSNLSMVPFLYMACLHNLFICKFL